MEMMIGEKWCKIEIYNEYLKKIPSLLCQINTVEKMQEKAEIELSMLESIPEDESKKQYRARLLSTKQRLKDMCEELRLVQTLKEQLEQELDILRTK